jgi:hypothetical protein
MIDMKNRQQVLTILAIVAIAFWAGDKLVFSPLTAGWKARTEEMTRLEKSIRQGKLVLDRERTIRGRWEIMETNTLPQEQSVAENQVLKAFDRWSEESRISITSIKPQWKMTGEDYMTLDCRVDAFGNLDTVTRFLYNVEKDPMALKVDMVELSPRDKEGAQITVGLQVSGLVLTSSKQ